MALSMKLAASISCALLFVDAPAADTTRYVVVSSGKQTGVHRKWTDGHGQIGYYYEFNDRGRGPRLEVSIRTNVEGLVVERIATGHDYFKALVNERFVLTGEKAAWTNHIENVEQAVLGKALYSPLNSVPAEIELVIKSLHKAPGHQLNLLPAGSIKATHLKNHSTRLDGLIIELELYSLSGFGGPPSFVWCNPKRDFFALVNSWSSVIVEGHDDLIPELQALQDEIEANYFFEQATSLTEKATGAVAIKNVSVFDANKGTLAKGRTVLIEGGRITQVGKSKRVKIPATAKVIDGTNKTLLPGLWDNHTHYDKTQGLYHLAGGVTNIKDMGNSFDLPDVKKKVDADELLGPEISVLSGFIDFAGPYAGPAGKIVSTLDEGLAAVDFFAAHGGYSQVKLYSSIPVEWVKPLAQRAHEKGLKVCGHIPSFMTAERAVSDGYDQIIHLNMVMLNFLGDTIDTRSMKRFSTVAERSGKINTAGPEVKRFVALLKERKTVVDPTIAIFEGMFTNAPGKLAKGYDAVAATFPPEYKRSLYYGGLPTIKGNEAAYSASFTTMLAMIRTLHQAGITIVPGTDDFPGFALHRELELYSQAGISNADVLKSATLVSARVAGMEKDLGTVEVGKKANLVLIDGNPLENISDVRKVALTIKGGNLYEPKALYNSYGFGYYR
jgi:hypothetical protein